MDKLIIAGREFNSRLMLGTGKFSSLDLMKESIEESGAEIITVALRRVDLTKPNEDILSFIDKDKYLILPNTAGASSADEAVLIAKMAQSAGLGNWIKLEVEPDPRHHLPDPSETLKAAEILVKDGFVVLPYMNADPVLAKRLEDAGCATVMPLASPIGTNKGITTRNALEIIIQSSNIPVVIDAGLGSPSHVSEAMEIGADAVLVNTAIATAENPKEMAKAFSLGTLAGRKAFLSGIPTQGKPTASSPMEGMMK